MHVVRDAVQLVLMDKGFKIPSSSAKTAVETAEKLLEWCSQAENKEVFGQFATDLLQELHGWKNINKLRRGPLRNLKESVNNWFHHLVHDVNVYHNFNT